MAKRPKARPATVDVSPKAEADDQQHVGKKPKRPRARPATVDVSPKAEADDQQHVKGYKAGGRVQVSGRNFRGTF